MQLIEALIINRPNRFIMNVMVDREIQKCHCPCTGKIGQIIFENVPCLLSKSENKNRKTPYTVEAISVDDKKSWIGINQNAANRYIEHFIKTNQLKKITGDVKIFKREQKFGKSRIDFLINDTFIEVKTPLTYLNIKKYSKKIKLSDKVHVFTSMERMVKHSNDLKKISQSNKKAVMIVCFMYDSPTFAPPKDTNTISGVSKAVMGMISKGTTIWQVNIKISQNEVTLIKYFKLFLDL